MKELDFLKIIKETLSANSHIGDDCAYLKELKIVITQDSLVEDIHFSTNFSTPYQIAYKSIVVNLSDIFASGAVPKYLTISLSLPQNTEKKFVKEFYKACEDLSKEFGFEIVGGDITGSDKIFISVCAIGLTEGRKISSRGHAKVGDYVVVTGVHGSSAAGLVLLKETGEAKSKKQKAKSEIISLKLLQRASIASNAEIQEKIYSLFTTHHSLVKAHLMPNLQKKFSNEIATKIDRDYAMMDTSDGLVDALFKIAQASDVLISVDFDKIPYDKKIEEVANLARVDFKDWILYGGEDYQLVACIDEENLKKIDKKLYTIIGRVKEKEKKHFVKINSGENILKIANLEKTFNHFDK